MIQIKKTILTLVALFAMTAGAWADAVPVTELKASDINAWIGDDTALTAADLPGFTAVSDEEVVNIPAPLTNGAIFMIYAFNGTNIKFVTYYNGAQVYKGEDYYNRDNIAYNAFDAGYIIYYTGTAPSGPKVAWDKTKNTGTFTMPGGNVTLEPEYYPQATLAFQGLTAAEDAAAKTDAPLAVLADGAVTGGTLMYYVATDKNFSQADAIALAETQWSAAIPTAETVEAAGTCYVWYYIKGDAEHSDTDPVPLAVTLLPEPTYAVTFAEGTPETDKWTASPNTGVKKGTAVTVTYTGSKKVIGVKAEKKEAAPASLIVNPVVGQVIGSDGKNYAYASLPTGVTAVAKICYVSGSNGLALALTDEGKMNWSTAQTTCAAHTPAITGGMWKLATKDEWNNMINAADSYDALRDGFSSVGGTNMQSDYYWSSTEADSLRAWDYRFVGGYWYDGIKTTEKVARACLAF